MPAWPLLFRLEASGSHSRRPAGDVVALDATEFVRRGARGLQADAAHLLLDVFAGERFHDRRVDLRDDLRRC
jgi:hypothetical protein